MSQIPSICRKGRRYSELSEIRSPPRMSIRRMPASVVLKFHVPENHLKGLWKSSALPPLLIKNFSSKGTYPLTTFSLFLIYTEFLGTANQVNQQIFSIRSLVLALDSQRILEISQEYSEVMYLNTL